MKQKVGDKQCFSGSLPLLGYLQHNSTIAKLWQLARCYDHTIKLAKEKGRLIFSQFSPDVTNM